MPRKPHGTKHFRDQSFLKALGAHCRRLRMQQGYSIDRLARESEQLSTSVIHRLEEGSGAVTVSALYRFAKSLGLHPRVLLDFEIGPFAGRPALTILPLDHPRVEREKFKTLLPLLSLRASAGYFGSAREVEPEGWVEVAGKRKLEADWFVAQAVGESMAPRIRSGDYLVFRSNPPGGRQGKIVLAEYRGPSDPETGGSYTIKVYHSSKIVADDGAWAHHQITLSPVNPDFEPIVLTPKDARDFRIVAEYLFSL